MLFASAALRTLQRKDSKQAYREFVEGLAAASGVPTPTLAELAAFDRKRKGKTLSNQEWESPTDPDARVAKMKDGTTHLAHKAEHAVDVESGALVGATLQAADLGDTATLGATLEAVEAAQAVAPKQVVADKGYHSDAVLLALDEAGPEAHIPEPQRAQRDFEGKPEAERVVKANRERVHPPWRAQRASACRSCGRRRWNGRWRTCTRPAGCGGCTCGGGRTFASGYWCMPAGSTWGC